jgi:TetR/AcrR family transcriptional repressor of nem operon
MASKGQNTREKILANTEALLLERGFAGTSIDEILAVTGITKGAFFYHFKSKADLARALVERYATRDYELFQQFSTRADQLSDDPLQSMLIFLKLFEEFVENLNAPPAGCVFASYLYENQQFDQSIKDFIAQGFQDWMAIYEKRIERILEKYPPRTEVNPAELAEMIASIIEGGLILTKSLQDPKLLVRTTRHFRQYLRWVFEPSV